MIRSSMIFAFILVAFPLAHTEAQRRPMFVCLELPSEFDEVIPEALSKVERALNSSGAFITSQIAKSSPKEPTTDTRPNTIPPEGPLRVSSHTRPVHPAKTPNSTKQKQGSRHSINHRVGGFHGISSRTPPFAASPPLEFVPPNVFIDTNIELLFQETLVNACRAVYPDVLSRSSHSTPFRHKNCSVLCIYGFPPVDIPEGGMCYQQRNFIGTPGQCVNGQCVISGEPFKFDFPPNNEGNSNTFSRSPFNSGFIPHFHRPSQLNRFPPRR